jgi:hypothetical protein
MLIFQPPVNFCSDENIQTIFGTNLEDFLNYRIDYNSISQTIEKVVKKIFFSAPKASKIGDRQVLVEPRPSESKSYAYKAVSLSMIIVSAEWP